MGYSSWITDEIMDFCYPTIDLSTKEGVLKYKIVYDGQEAHKEYGKLLSIEKRNGYRIKKLFNDELKYHLGSLSVNDFVKCRDRVLLEKREDSEFIEIDDIDLII